MSELKPSEYRGTGKPPNMAPPPTFSDNSAPPPLQARWGAVRPLLKTPAVKWADQSVSPLPPTKWLPPYH